MKSTNDRQSGVSLTPSRWAAYAAAGAATALGSAATAEGRVHYSGEINSVFRAPSNWSINFHQQRSFPLEGGAYIVFAQGFSQSSGIDYFGLKGAAVSSEVRGHKLGGFAENLDLGITVSQGDFFRPGMGHVAILTWYGYHSGSFGDPGVGFVGFRFDNGAGTQYGWARIRLTGHPLEFFVVVAYAWGDPGDPIMTGKRALQDQPMMKVTAPPSLGSLGFLALGAKGLRAWRQQRAAESQEP